MTSEQFYQNVIATALDGFCLTNLQGRIQDVNDAYCKMLGYTREELLAKSITDIEVLEDEKEVARHKQKILTQGFDRFKTQHRRKDGTVLDVEISVRSTAETVEGFIVFIHDITERRHTETLVEKLNEAQHLTKIGSWDWNLKTNTVWWSDETYEIFGMQQGEYIPSAEKNARYYHPDDVELFGRAVEQSLKTGAPVNMDLRLIVNGQEKFCYVQAQAKADASGKIVRLAGTIRDISERHRDSLQLIQAKDDWERTFDAVPDLISIIDSNHKIVHANRAMAEKLGVTTEEAVGMLCYECVHGLSTAPAFCPHARLMADGKAHTEEVEEARLGGTHLITCSPLYDRNGKLLGSVHVARDITALKRATEHERDSNRKLVETLNELRETQNQLVQRENLRVMGQMAAGIAHDFNNALSPIIGFTELLTKHPEKLADHDAVRQRLQVIHSCATDAARVVRRIREFGRQDAATETFAPVDLPKLVRQTIELTQPRWQDQAQSAGVNIEIKTEFFPVTPVPGDEFAIREMLTNLVFNAVDALSHDGSITIGTAMDGQFVRLWVKDTGVGMTDEVRQCCMQPFYTTKGEVGSGLGLAMVHSIVRRHRGTVDIESELGTGTNIIVRFPLEQQTGKAPTSQLRTAALKQPRRVLIVDDKPMLRTVVESWLTLDGHTVETAADGVEALARLQVNKFDLVITDKAMPKMNGELLAAEIHKKYPGLPVVMLTGFGDIIKASGNTPAHVAEVLSKPVTQEALRAALKKVLG